MTTNLELHARRTDAIPRGVANSFPIYAERAENAEIWDVDGKRYIDFAAGIAVLNTGHRHPKVVEAIRRQLDQVTHACFQVTPYAPYVELAERLNALAPGDHAKKTIFLTTGAEAVENAVKIARAHTGRPAVIAFSGAFHGRTLLTMALTGKVAPYKTGFGPFPGDIFHAPFPSADTPEAVQQSLAGLHRIFAADVEPSRVAAIIIEPVQGEGGFNVTPFALLRGLREICDRHGIVLIVDEIQTGFARTGRMFAVEHSGVVPDLMTTAKSLGGGLPLSAVTGRKEIMDAPIPGGLGGTYAGNALACAAALAVLDVIAEERLVERSATVGARMAERLRQVARRNTMTCIAEVRGLGSMLAIELVEDRHSRAPATALTRAVLDAAARRGLILLACGVHGNVIRFLAPLTAADGIIDEGLDILEAALEEVTAASLPPRAQAG